MTTFWSGNWVHRRFLQGGSFVFGHLDRWPTDALRSWVILNCLKLMGAIFLVDSPLWTKSGFIATNHKPKNNQSSGTTRHLRPQRRSRSFLQWAMPWSHFSGIPRVPHRSFSEFLPWEGPHNDWTTFSLIIWNVYAKQSRKRGQKWPQEEFSSAMTMPQDTPQWLSWQHFVIVDSNLFRIPLSL